jgi:ABC-2 type transport system permease protein
MTTARIDAAAATVRREAQLYFSYRLRFAGQLVAVLLSLTLFYYLSRFVDVEPFASPDEYFAFVVAGVAILEVLTATVALLPNAVRNELLTGTFERPIVSPFGPVAHIVSMAAWPVLIAMLISTITILVAVALFGLSINTGGLPLVLPVAALSAAAFLPLALLLAALVLIVKQAAGVTAFLVTSLSLSSGAFFPRDVLPWWIGWIAEVQPLTPALELLRHQLVGSPVEGSPAIAVLKLAAFTIVLMPVGLAALRSSVALCRRRGTLTEY